MKYKLNTIFLFLLVTTFSFAQQTITGVVKSTEDSELLPGVTILLKGTDTGVSTDFDGKFSIEAPFDGVLIVSFIGFKTQEVIINNRSNLEINLQVDVTSLDEVVVVGYGTQKKSDITGATASVKVDELKSLPSARVDEALQGRVAGVQVINNDASPNANVSIRIRGVSSINGGNDPLIVIDGVQGGNLSEVHPKDIKSMEVLKDASATAIYGSRGASGVILITTKKGRDSKPSLTYNTYSTFNEIRNKIDLLNASQYAGYINDNRIANGLSPVFSPEQITDFETNGGTDWQDEIFRSGYSQNHHLNVSGGGENIVYSFSGDYLDTKGLVIGSSFKKISQRSNVSINLGKKFKINLNSFLSFSEDNPTELNSRDRQGSPIYSASIFSPTKPVYNLDGTYSQPGGGAGPNTEYNPFALAKEPIRDNFSNKLAINPSIEWNIIEGFDLLIRGSYTLIDNENNFYYNEKVVNGDESDREASIYNGRWSNFQNTNILTYKKVFAEKHNLNITAVYERQTTKFNDNYSSSRDFLTNAVTYNNLELGASPGIPSSYRSEETLESLMGRLSYSFMERYSITLTGRSDGSSVFAENNKRAFFPSVGFAWNISNEKFLEESNTIDNLKLRASYGEVGNAAISPYQSLAQLVTGSNFSFSGSDLTTGVNLSTQAPNPDLKWETTKTFNAGIDIRMFNGRLSLIADYYDKSTTDLLLERALKQASGFQTQLVNTGEVSNKGFEITLSGSPIAKNDFEWNTDITFSKNKNEVLSLTNDESSIRLGGAGLPGFSDAIWIEVGQPIGLIKGLEYNGVWKSDEAILADVYNVIPGSPKYIDQNNDGLINDDDIVNIANAQPDFTFGWNNTFTFKNLDLNIFINGVQGNDIYNIARSRTEDTNDGTSMNLLNVWSPTNEDTDVPGHTALGDFRNSSRWVEDGSYVRIKNITLGYNFAKKHINKAGISNLRIYLSGTNLFTFTDYTGYDPESNNSWGSDTFAGVDLASYPSQKMYTIGLDIKF